MAVTPLRSPEAAARWLRAWVRGTLRTDSRRVQAGDAFIAWPGYGTDGRAHVAQALAAGATTCLVEQEGIEPFAFDDARIASLPRLKLAAGAVADAYFDQPSAALDVVAVTGTNGKTSTAWWVAQSLTRLGRRCGLMGTLGVGEPPAEGQAASLAFNGLTTPDPVLAHASLAQFVQREFKACALEASSVGLEEGRLAGVRVAVAVFTNFTQDHLDYHGTMARYWQAKRKLFAWPGLRAAVINVDDAAGVELAQSLEGQAIQLGTCSVQANAGATWTARGVRYEDGGLAFEVHEAGEPAAVSVRTRLIGDYNVSNVLGVIGSLRALGVSLADACAGMPSLTPVPGRMQSVGQVDEPQVVVDYAHTPDALDKALRALRPLAQQRGGQLVCVFGCGGDRDPGKRAPMSATAEALADRLVLTSDNPRSESPTAILATMQGGLKQVERATCIVDRRAAIEHALGTASALDVVLVAGKGHEDYQEVQGVKHPFSDVLVVEQALAARRQRGMTSGGGASGASGSTVVARGVAA